MNILFTICGRSGSKGVKNKNTQLFCGLPISCYALAVIQLFRQKHAEQYDRLDVVLSTDSPHLKTSLLSVDPGIFCVDRIESLSGDAVRKIDVIRDAALRAEQHFGVSYTTVVDFDITAPMRTLANLEAVIEKRRTSDADVIYTVTSARRNPYFNQVMKHETGYYSTVCNSHFAARQQAPKIYDMNCALYAYAPNYIHSEKPIFDKADIVLMKDYGFLDIDSHEDLYFMQLIAEHEFVHDEALKQMHAEAARLSAACEV